MFMNNSYHNFLKLPGVFTYSNNEQQNADEEHRKWLEKKYVVCDNH